MLTSVIRLDSRALSVTLDQPVVIDLGGIAKGFAVDRALERLADRRLEQAIINAGGDIGMLHPEGETIHIRHPDPEKEAYVSQPMLAPAVATTSNTFKGDGHASFIIDPRSRDCLDDCRSISIFAPHCVSADALTKAAFLMPQNEFEQLLAEYGATMLVLS